MKKKILLVEDEDHLGIVLKTFFEKKNFNIEVVKDGEDALFQADNFKPDVVLLDWMLPNMSGLEICRQIRTTKGMKKTPIIFLTAKGEEEDKLRALDTGADDYITKPFSMRELIARIHGVLRRVTWGENASLGNRSAVKVLSTSRISINTESHEVLVSGTSVSLKPKEYELLTLLIVNKGKVLSRNQILNAVWGYDFYGDTRTVDVHIRWLREKIEENPSSPVSIQTVRGVGYQLKE